jgi:hypothetical protein
MLQKLAQDNGQPKLGRPRKRGERTAEGQQRQIAARISNGVHFQSPVLPNGIEKKAAWDAHLARLEEALQPVGSWERLCVYRIALSAWKHFRLVRHEAAIISAAILKPDNGFKSRFDQDYVRAGDVSEVIGRSESSLGEEMFEQRDFMLRVKALAGKDFSDITFLAAERRQILTAIIKQPVYDADGLPAKSRIAQELLEGLDEGDGFSEEDDCESGHEEDLAGQGCDEGADTGDVSAAQLRKEINQIAEAKCVDTNEAIEELAAALASGIRERQRRLEVARTHIGCCLVPDEKNVNRLALYERQLDAASRRYLNDLYRAQALRLGQPVAAPIAVDVNVTGEQGNGLH